MPQQQRPDKVRKKLAELKERAKNPRTQTTVLQVSVNIHVAILLHEFMIEENKMNLSGIVSDILQNRLRDVRSVREIDPTNNEIGKVKRKLARIERRIESIELELSAINP